MKAIFISYNQAYGEEIIELLEKNGQRGFTRFDETSGRGSLDGEPHYGNHAWPTLNVSVITMVPDSKVAQIMDDLRDKDRTYPDLGLRAYVMPVEESL